MYVPDGMSDGKGPFQSYSNLLIDNDLRGLLMIEWE